MSRRLITIPISHYCERARWALEWAGLDVVEERHLQIFHARAVRRAGGRRTVPVLIDGDQVFTDSADIVAHADATGRRRLYPDDPGQRAEVEAFERELAGSFGVETRRLAYGLFLELPKLMLRYNNQGAPAHERLAVRLGFRFAKARLARYLDINAATAERAAETVSAVFDEVARRLESAPYLGGERFTAVDLTFAALAAPVVLPAEYGVRLPEPGELPEAMRQAIEGYREHPAGRFALKMYRRHRR